MLGQADYGCVSEKEPAHWTIDLFNFLITCAGELVNDNLAVCSAATSLTGFLYLKKKIKSEKNQNIL